MTSLFQSTFTLPAPTVDASLPPLCPSDRPLALLPVRLETRFVTEGAATELRIRVYPDKIHVSSHEAQLLQSEDEWGRHYWDQDWRAATDDAARADAWRQLADRFGAERAAFVAQSLRPTNPASDRPTAPVAAGAALPHAITFPAASVSTDPNAAAWRSAPVAQLLPDRWIAVLQSGATKTQMVSKDIVTPLHVGPDPTVFLDPTIPDDQLVYDESMKWMIDFDAAELKGMALRVPMTAAMLSTGIDRLLVFGVIDPGTGSVATTSANATADQFGALLNAHHYTDGLEFLPNGTPTNNTPDSNASGIADDAKHERSFANEVKSLPLSDGSNGRVLGTALGLGGSTADALFARVGHGNGHHALDMQHMNTALWQAGWGYFLSNMVGAGTPPGTAATGTGLTTGAITWTRDHFMRYVRAGGPYAALRFGGQPYGVLPVTSLDLWAGDATMLPDAYLRSLLVKLRDTIWRARLVDALRLGRRAGPDVDADLMDVMRTEGVSSSYTTRTFLGMHYFTHLRAFVNEDVTTSGWFGFQNSLARTPLVTLGLPTSMRLVQTVPDDQHWAVTVPLVQSGDVASGQPLQEPNYINALLGKNIQDLIADRPPVNGSATSYSLLHALLRHSLLREIADAAAKIVGTIDATVTPRDPELINLVTGAPLTSTTKSQLATVVPSVTGTKQVSAFLEGLTTYNLSSTTALGELRASLAYLKGLDTQTLQYLMQGTLDLSAHRLDAWITSFATKRLTSMRSAAPNGLYVGAYGWVENLRPLAAATLVTTPVTGEPGRLVMTPNDGGFIHAPSTTHAAAAAMLRNSHLGATGIPQPNSPFAIDLSSRRVREAERLLDGVRQGQPLGALLGYRIERSLHDAGADTAVPQLRAYAPLAGVPIASGMPTESIAPNNVVDGLTLYSQWTADNGTALIAQLKAAQVSQAAITAVTNEIAVLGDAIDGLSDALTAESAYQMARGNINRTATTLSAIAQGEAPPPELEVVHTPRSGVSLTHRLVTLFSGLTNLATTGWPTADIGVRSSADKVLNFWVARMFGDARKIRCTIERLDASGAVVETRTMPITDLTIQPIDVVYSVDADASATSSDGTLSVLEQLVLYRMKHVAGGFDRDATLRIQHARPTTLAAGELTLFDIMEQARALRRLLAGARGAAPEDLNPPERTVAGTIDLAELEARVVRAEDGLNAAHKQLQSEVGRVPTATELLRTAIMKVGSYVVGPAVPCVATGDDAPTQAALVAQAKGVLKTSGARMDQVTALRAKPAATDEAARCAQLVARMRNAFGDTIVVLPHFTCDAAAATELTSALAATKNMQGGDALAANGWFTRVARVREAAARFGACVTGADVLGTGERLNLCVAQLPFTMNDRWVALPPAAGKEITASKLSLVLQTVAPIAATQALTGLVIDEWTEVVPSARESTAVAFQLNPPDAAPPQNVLLAVPPQTGVAWTTDTLGRVLVETLDLTKIRAVDPETLGAIAQYVPGLYFAFNTNDDVVSTDFAALTQ